MIVNDAELAIVRTQLGRIELALEDLRRTVQPKSESMYELMAETSIDMQRSLQADIDDYLRRKSASSEPCRKASAFEFDPSPVSAK